MSKTMQAATYTTSPSDRSLDRNTYTHLTYSRHHLRDIAIETIKIAENGHYTNRHGATVHLKEDLDWAVEHCTHYEDQFDFASALQKHDADRKAQSMSPPSSIRSPKLDRILHRENPDRFARTDFLVVSASWLESASELLGASSKIPIPADSSNISNINDYIRVGVLNSASSTTPGGKFLNGTVSQEDCLCRASLLYSCISQPRFQGGGKFYGMNRSLKYGSSNCVIFSPDVPVIREDNVEGKLLDKYQKISFVTIPAPNAFTTSTQTGKEYNDNEHEQRMRNVTSMTDLTSLASTDDIDFDEKFEEKRLQLLSSLSDRIHRALGAFALGNCTDLILPAFGCGVHGNDPSMVANVFRDMLTDPNKFGGRFRTVVFAIPPSRKQNYQAFAAYFQKKEVGVGGAKKPKMISRGISLQ